MFVEARFGLVLCARAIGEGLAQASFGVLFLKPLCGHSKSRSFPTRCGTFPLGQSICVGTVATPKQLSLQELRPAQRHCGGQNLVTALGPLFGAWTWPPLKG